MKLNNQKIKYVFTEHSSTTPQISQCNNPQK